MKGLILIVQVFKLIAPTFHELWGHNIVIGRETEAFDRIVFVGIIVFAQEIASWAHVLVHTLVLYFFYWSRNFMSLLKSRGITFSWKDLIIAGAEVYAKKFCTLIWIFVFQS